MNNLMMHEIGIALFPQPAWGWVRERDSLDTIIYERAYVWIGYGAIITVVPLLVTDSWGAISGGYSIR